MKLKSNENLFSVSMSVYKNDCKEHFGLAIDSVVKQSVPPSEIVLVVDGPVGNDLNEVIKEKETKINSLKVIRLNENKGHGEARRIGLENCSHDIVALMDSDDICLPNRFEKQLEALSQNIDVSIVGGQIEEFDDDIGEVIGIRNVPLEDEEIKSFLKNRCPMNQMTVMFRKTDIQKAGGYLDWHNNEDYYLWIRMVLKGFKFMNLNETLVNVRVNTNMYRRRGGWNYFKSEARLQKFMFNHGLIVASKYLLNICIRFIVQVLMPNSLRQIVFNKIFRN